MNPCSLTCAALERIVQLACTVVKRADRSDSADAYDESERRQRECTCRAHRENITRRRSFSPSEARRAFKCASNFPHKSSGIKDKKPSTRTSGASG